METVASQSAIFACSVLGYAPRPCAGNPDIGAGCSSSLTGSACSGLAPAGIEVWLETLPGSCSRPATITQIGVISPLEASLKTSLPGLEVHPILQLSAGQVSRVKVLMSLCPIVNGGVRRCRRGREVDQRWWSRGRWHRRRLLSLGWGEASCCTKTWSFVSYLSCFIVVGWYYPDTFEYKSL
jgi:hypothetical protein